MSGYLAQFLLPTLAIVALVVIGVAFGPRAGAAKGRMWLGLGLIIAVQALSAIWAIAYIQLASSIGFRFFGPVNALWSIVSLALLVAGVGVLVSAVVIGQRSSLGYLDPSRPGAPPVAGYQGHHDEGHHGYPGSAQPDGQTSSPYPEQTPEGFHRP
jgi:hypothetical protein